GCTLTAWSAAGLFGPTFVTRVQENTGSYATTLYVFAGLFAVALFVTGLMTLDIRAKRAAQSAAPAEPATPPSATDHGTLRVSR
ncbi:MAG: hypothetical protein AAFX76_13395, partial [Planctomycetota bacterium]